jgi:hypothetical protein
MPVIIASPRTKSGNQELWESFMTEGQRTPNKVWISDEKLEDPRPLPGEIPMSKSRFDPAVRKTLTVSSPVSGSSAIWDRPLDVRPETLAIGSAGHAQSDHSPFGAWLASWSVARKK